MKIRKLLTTALMTMALTACMVVGVSAGDAPVTTFTDTEVAELLAKSLAGEIDGVKGVEDYKVSGKAYDTEANAKVYIEWLTDYAHKNGLYTSDLAGYAVTEFTVTVNFTDDSYVTPIDGDYSVAENGKINYTITVSKGEVSYTSNETTYSFAAVVTYHYTRDVTDAEEFIDALNVANVVGTTVDINLMNDITIDTDDFDNATSLIQTFYGGQINGNNHTITFDLTEQKYMIYEMYGSLDFIDLNVQYSQNYCAFLLLINRGDCTMKNVNILDYDPDVMIEGTNNFSPYVSHTFMSLTMEDCTNHEQFSITLYGGIFVGGYMWDEDDTVTFINCVNSSTGAIYGQNVSMFMGNNNRASELADNAITVTGCVNYGTIQGTATASIFCEGTSGSSGETVYSTKVNGDCGFTNEGIMRVINYPLSGSAASTGEISVVDENVDSGIVVENYRIVLRAYSYVDGMGTLYVEVATKFENLDITNPMRYGTFITKESFQAKFGEDELLYDAPWSDIDATYAGYAYQIAVVEDTLYYVFNEIKGANGYYYTFGDDGRKPSVFVEAYDTNGIISANNPVTVPSEIAIPDIEAAINDVAYFALADAVSALTIGDTITILETPDATTITMKLDATVVNSTDAAITVQFNSVDITVAAGESYTATQEEADTAVEKATVDLTTDSTLEEIQDAATALAAIDNDALASDDDHIDTVNTVDQLLIDAINADGSGSIEVSNIIDVSSVAITNETDIDVDSLKINTEAKTEVQGLAISAVGTDTTEDIVTGLKIDQTAASSTIDTETGDTTTVVTYDITPYKQVNSGEVTTIENDEISAPITFKLYLPSIFSTTNRATVVHKDGDTVYSTKTYTVYSDENGSYITITTTHFSEFEVTYADKVSSSSSSTTYYQIDASVDGNGSISPANSVLGYVQVKKGDSKTFTFTADDGYEIDYVLVDGDSVGAVETYTFSSVSGNHTIEAVFVTEGTATETETETETEIFSDVSSSDWFYDAVLWAFENDITDGMSDTTFEPNTVCTRAQAVTFLWKAAGSPEATGENIFTDVSSSDWYYDAVLWAFENGITLGTSDTAFSPADECSRAHIVTFLARYAGGTATEENDTFTDVIDGEFYADAVAWAVENEITDGMSDTTFEPNTECTRAQIVTFLYRYMA